jgi:hypothetical protein
VEIAIAHARFRNLDEQRPLWFVSHGRRSLNCLGGAPRWSNAIGGDTGAQLYKASQEELVLPEAAR